MSVEARPFGVKCNIQCLYCYQNPQRDADNFRVSYDLEEMKAGLEREGGSFTLFGGEPLMVPLKDLEDLWAWGYERFGSNAVQTNGALITGAHIDLFKKYKVHVGMSVDGPLELNDVRWAGSLETTREMTARTHAAIERLCREGIPPSLIVTLHRGNAEADKLPVMHEWFRYLERIGVTSARLHVLEVEDVQVARRLGLTPEENLAAFRSFERLEREQLTFLKLDVFQDMRRLLMGEDNNTTCIWNACDPYTTAAVRGVEGHGQSSNCGRTNKDGIDFVKADREGFERYLALYNTPQECGGCRDCRFFIMCKGQCPGTAIDHDWRNRSADCELWKALFAEVESLLVAEGKHPLSLLPERVDIENHMLAAWSTGRNLNICGALSRLVPRDSEVSNPSWHVDTPHGDDGNNLSWEASFPTVQD